MAFTNCLKPPSQIGTGYFYPAITIFVCNIHETDSEQTVGDLKNETSWLHSLWRESIGSQVIRKIMSAKLQMHPGRWESLNQIYGSGWIKTE